MRVRPVHALQPSKVASDPSPQPHQQLHVRVSPPQRARQRAAHRIMGSKVSGPGREHLAHQLRLQPRSQEGVRGCMLAQVGLVVHHNLRQGQRRQVGGGQRGAAAAGWWWAKEGQGQHAAQAQTRQQNKRRSPATGCCPRVQRDLPVG
jgi:hypothetical protein